jgi:hypothetical protein
MDSPFIPAKSFYRKGRKELAKLAKKTGVSPSPPDPIDRFAAHFIT